MFRMFLKFNKKVILAFSAVGLFWLLILLNPPNIYGGTCAAGTCGYYGWHSCDSSTWGCTNRGAGIFDTQVRVSDQECADLGMGCASGQCTWGAEWNNCDGCCGGGGVCYDINKFHKVSGSVLLDQNRSNSTSGDSAAGTGGSTNPVRIHVNNLCAGFSDDYDGYPNNSTYSITTYKDTTGHQISCVPPAG